MMMALIVWGSISVGLFVGFILSGMFSAQERG